MVQVRLIRNAIMTIVVISISIVDRIIIRLCRSTVRKTSWFSLGRQNMPLTTTVFVSRKENRTFRTASIGTSVPSRVRWCSVRLWSRFPVWVEWTQLRFSALTSVECSICVRTVVRGSVRVTVGSTSVPTVVKGRF